jgi:DNA mismatch repair protein MutL
MRQRIVSILSGKTNEKLVPVQETEITIHGFISLNLLKNRGEQFFFVNDRFIKAVIHAIMAAYDGLYETAHNLVIFYT